MHPPSNIETEDYCECLEQSYTNTVKDDIINCRPAVGIERAKAQ